MKLKKLLQGKSWQNVLGKEFDKPYIIELEKFLSEQLKIGKTIYPQPADLFSALNLTPLKEVKVVILGQDPYHGHGQAHGLSFSVQPDQLIPPSLRNIFKELESDLSIPPAEHGFLKSWADQGVFLLNSTLTVEQGKAGSHQKKGWEIFTDTIISIINQNEEAVVFLLWGSFAQQKSSLINNPKHLILKAPHPSPLSAYKGFLGCRHFSQSNEFLKRNQREPINWQLK